MARIIAVRYSTLVADLGDLIGAPATVDVQATPTGVDPVSRTLDLGDLLLAVKPTPDGDSLPQLDVAVYEAVRQPDTGELVLLHADQPTPGDIIVTTAAHNDVPFQAGQIAVVDDNRRIVPAMQAHLFQ